MDQNLQNLLHEVIEEFVHADSTIFDRIRVILEKNFVFTVGMLHGISIDHLLQVQIPLGIASALKQSCADFLKKNALPPIAPEIPCQPIPSNDVSMNSIEMNGSSSSQVSSQSQENRKYYSVHDLKSLYKPALYEKLNDANYQRATFYDDMAEIVQYGVDDLIKNAKDPNRISAKEKRNLAKSLVKTFPNVGSEVRNLFFSC